MAGQDLVTIAGLAVFAGVIDGRYVIVPLLMAIINPANPSGSALIGALVVLLIGIIPKFVKIGRGD